MKRLFFVINFALITFICKAGEGDTYISLSGGWLHYNAISAELTFEKSLAYHNAWEVGLDYYNQMFSHHRDSVGKRIDRYSILFEAAYKHNLVRYKNANLRFRLVAGVGANDREKFTCSISPGFEYVYTTQGNIQLFIQEKTQFSFWSSNKSWFRTGIMIGMKIPLRL